MTKKRKMSNEEHETTVKTVIDWELQPVCAFCNAQVPSGNTCPSCQGALDTFEKATGAKLTVEKPEGPSTFLVKIKHP